MKAKKNMYKGGGKVDPPKGKKLTKEMVDKQFSSDLAKSMDFTNKLAKQAATGKRDGMPLSPSSRKSLQKQVDNRKKRESIARPYYGEVGKRLPAGDAPFEDDKSFKKGGMIAKKLKKRAAKK